jgi:hypothetical protein
MTDLIVYKIPIFLDEKINPIFVKAYTKLIEKKYLFIKENCSSSNDLKNILPLLWEEEYNSRLIFDNLIHFQNEIIFQTEQDKTIFLLKNQN